MRSNVSSASNASRQRVMLLPRASRGWAVTSNGLMKSFSTSKMRCISRLVFAGSGGKRKSELGREIGGQDSGAARR